MKAKTLKIASLILIGGIMVFCLFGCFAEKYEVTSDIYELKGLGKYREGATIELVQDIWLTDTDYTFYANGQKISTISFDTKRGYIITFKMPACDVHVTCEERNSMNFSDEFLDDEN